MHPGSHAPDDPEALIDNAVASSRYAARTLQARPDLRARLAASLDHAWGREEMAAWMEERAPHDRIEMAKCLRLLRLEVLLRVMVRDLGGRADLDEVVDSMTTLAELAVERAVDMANAEMRAQYGDPIGAASRTPQSMIVVGMGKLGGRELNVSSDIDLIFIYPEDGETDGPRRISNHQYFVQLGRQVIATLSEQTEDGYVFRVDMRLRPYGDSGPLASSFAMLEEYLITQGREWERYAWIKGRPLTGDQQDELTALIRPFVFRKYLDFGAFHSMRGLHGQIRQEVKRRDLEDNIKLGPGGIREIEFTAQVFQLIRGGRIASLRLRPTRTILTLLAQHDFLPAQTVSELRSAYVFLRNLEHRLQYLDDAQTHALPRTEHDREIIARTMGYLSWPEFISELDHHRSKVTRHFEQVFSAPQSEQESHPLTGVWTGQSAEESKAQLTQLGYEDADNALTRLAAFRDGTRYQRLPAANRSRLDALMPPLIEVCAQMRRPATTLERVLMLMETISGREPYLALMLEYPLTLRQVVKICAASAWAAHYLARHPVLLDELLDTQLLNSRPQASQLAAMLDETLLNAEGNVEVQMDMLRHFKQAHTFRLLVQDLSGTLPLETLSDRLSDLADVILEQVYRLCWKHLSKRHTERPRFSIIGYGKLGGKELGYASDLDIIFLYDDDDPEAPVIYARLAQRINTWLTSLTPAGELYETDLRLRPDGASGLLVSTLKAFDEYQRTKAWTWEHQALTRARHVAGDTAIGQAFERIRTEVLCQPREVPKLREDVVAMRDKMLAAHPNTSPLFDIKHDRGGIVDVEFIVQYLVLAHAPQHPDLTDNVGNLALLERCAAHSLIPDELASAAQAAYRQYRTWQHALRLQEEKYARIDPAEAEAHRRAVLALWDAVFGRA